MSANDTQFFFQRSLTDADPLIASLLSQESSRQLDQIGLIASENLVSQAVIEAQSSIVANKYAEGYPGKRYYAGCRFADELEEIAIARANALFGSQFANVQPHSGAQANSAVMLALLQPGDTVLGMSLNAGGHLTHGARVTLSGKWFHAVHYGVRTDTCEIDYEEVAKLAFEHRPRLIIAGSSAYPRKIDWAKFREIADAVGAYLMVDMAHIAGLVAAGLHESPLPHAHIVTSASHQTLRGPRGGFILSNEEEIARQINAAVFPGIQGGPMMHVIAGKAVAFAEAATPAFKAYAEAVLENARAMGEVLQEGGVDLVTKGTDNHLLLVDLRPKGLWGNEAEVALERVGITCNKNGIPFDTAPPKIASGIRLGTPMGTSRGFGVREFQRIGELVLAVLAGLQIDSRGHTDTERRVRDEVAALCRRFPMYTS
ncbi:serine hydroxymethyltransferase [Leeia sp. TBRC 13508]|uniref:Serine hydroxymethyltransferase n=1 Tax=Leeia speluncae TaxID=2884804 RepID=A0ABS8DAC5_9NEIS|nr:serine hydroxymethyltransferase [Leeia speluncae]